MIDWAEADSSFHCPEHGDPAQSALWRFPSSNERNEGECFKAKREKKWPRSFVVCPTKQKAFLVSAACLVLNNKQGVLNNKSQADKTYPSRTVMGARTGGVVMCAMVSSPAMDSMEEGE